MSSPHPDKDVDNNLIAPKVVSAICMAVVSLPFFGRIKKSNTKFIMIGWYVFFMTILIVIWVYWIDGKHKETWKCDFGTKDNCKYRDSTGDGPAMGMIFVSAIVAIIGLLVINVQGYNSNPENKKDE